MLRSVDAKNQFETPMVRHPNFTLKKMSSWVNYRVKLGCQSIGVSYTVLGSPNIMEYCCILDFLR